MKDIVIRDLCKAFDGKPVLERLSFTFPAGGITCVMGPSGSGKTTLLRILLGLEQPDSGSVENRPRRPAAVFQEDRLCESFSPLRNLLLVTGVSVSPDQALDHLRQLGLADCARQPVSSLSGGMKRRVALARAVLYGGDALILDEPFKGLDPETHRRAMEYVLAHRGDRSLICVTHEDSEARFLGGGQLYIG